MWILFDVDEESVNHQSVKLKLQSVETYTHLHPPPAGGEMTLCETTDPESAGKRTVKCPEVVEQEEAGVLQ